MVIWLVLINDSVIYVDICFTNQIEFVAVSNILYKG